MTGSRARWLAAVAALALVVTPASQAAATPSPWWAGLSPWRSEPTQLQPFDPPAPPPVIVIATGPVTGPSPVAAGPAELIGSGPMAGKVDCRVTRCVALTFDDGPSPHTSRLLDILAAEHVTATFFIVGSRVEERPDVVARIRAEGHEIGNHTWSHPQLPHLSAASAAEEFESTQQAIAGATGGYRPTVMRPPFGAHDATSDAAAGEAALSVIIWDVDTLDWKTKSTDATVAAVASGTRPGSIVLMHDTHPTTVDAVPRVIAELKAQGYTFVTVTDILDDRGMDPGVVYNHGPR